MRTLLAVMILSWSAIAQAVTVEGTVFRDANGDGVQQSDEPALPNISVSWEARVFTTTDAQGHYSLAVPSDGVVWARTPDGYVPTPTWKLIAVAAGASQTADLGLKPSKATGPVSFLHASDLHIDTPNMGPDDAPTAIAIAGRLEPAPTFMVMTGDITQGEDPPEFAKLRDSLAGIDLPLVPVIGNHDLYQNGNSYRKALGPTQYSFESGGVHFIVLDHSRMNSLATATSAGVLDFVKADMKLSPASMPAVVFTHAPQPDDLDAALADLGVTWMFTGHWHSNRIIEHGKLTEVNTQPLLMGGIDFTPAGYRVATWVDTTFALTDFLIVDEPVLSSIWPRAGGCIPPGAQTFVAAAHTGSGVPAIAVELDCQPAQPMTAAGGWDYTLPVTATPGSHTLTLRMTGGGAPDVRVDVDYCVAAAPAPGDLPDWPELMASAEHHGQVGHRVAPPLTAAWSATLGGHSRGGSPSLGGGRLFVPVADFGPGTAGGVVAFDAKTGAKLWEVRSGYSVHNTPAVDGDVVVFGAANGVVHAVDAATGHELWKDDLGAGLATNVSWLYSAPSIVEGTVYVGTQKHFAALDEKTGREMWSVDPSANASWLGSFAAAGVSDGVVIGNFSRGADGIVAWRAEDGHEMWRIPQPLSTAINGSVVIDGGLAFFGNSETDVYAVDLMTASVRWQKKLFSSGFDFGYGIAATPALGGGKLVVPTQYGVVIALDAQSGAESWRHETGTTVLRPVHYYGAGTKPFASSPVVTADLVWIGGGDGVLRALDLETGTSVWSTNLGAPILAGPIPGGDSLFIATFDGTVQALRHVDDDPAGASVNVCNGQVGGGGCSVGGGGGGGAALLVLAALAWRRKRK